MILFPWDPAPMAFFELYRLAVPLFLPSIEWIIRVHRATGWIYTEKNNDIVLAGQHNNSHWPSQPFWDHDHGVNVNQVEYWYRWSDIANFPHVLYFDSAIQLFENLVQIYNTNHGEQLEDVRNGMVQINRLQLAETLLWYRRQLTTFDLVY